MRWLYGFWRIICIKHGEREIITLFDENSLEGMLIRAIPDCLLPSCDLIASDKFMDRREPCGKWTAYLVGMYMCLICLRKGGKMVIGDPNVFSIMIDVVDELNEDKTFNSGLLFMGIDGELFLPKITNTTLNVELFRLIENLKSSKKMKKYFKWKKRDFCLYL